MLVKNYFEQKNKYEFKYIEVRYDEVIQPGASVLLEVIPPYGEVYKVVWIETKISPPPNATTGNHQIYIFSHNTNYGLWAVQQYNELLRIGRNYAISASAAEPPDATSQFLVVTNIYSTRKYPLQILYFNNTDADQTNPIVVRFLVQILPEEVYAIE